MGACRGCIFSSSSVCGEAQRLQILIANLECGKQDNRKRVYVLWEEWAFQSKEGRESWHVCHLQNVVGHRVVRPSGYCLWHKGLVKGSCRIYLQGGIYLFPGWSCECLCPFWKGWIGIFADGTCQIQLRYWLGEGSEQVENDRTDPTGR